MYGKYYNYFKYVLYPNQAPMPPMMTPTTPTAIPIISEVVSVLPLLPPPPLLLSVKAGACFPLVETALIEEDEDDAFVEVWDVDVVEGCVVALEIPVVCEFSAAVVESAPSRSSTSYLR